MAAFDLLNRKKADEPTVEKMLDGMAEDADAAEAPQPKSTPKTSAPRRGSLERRLKEFFETCGAGLMFAGDMPCGTVLTTQAGPLAEALDKLAQQNKRIKAFLEAASASSAYGELFIATFPVIVAVAVHHGSLNPDIAAALGIQVQPKKPKDTRDEPDRGTEPMEDASGDSAAVGF